MSKKVLFLISVIITLQMSVLAQKERVYIGNGLATTMIKTSDYYKENTVYNSFWDFDSDFKYGIVYLINGDTIDNLGLRYNITRDRFEAICDTSDGIYIINPSSVKYIKRMSELFTFSKYMNLKGVMRKGYFKVLYDGNTKLYYRKAEIHKEGKHGAFGYSPYKTFDTNYYLKKADDAYPVIFKKRKKYILETLAYKGPKLEVYAKENHLRFSNIDDLIVILAYYDRLQKGI